MKEKKLFELVEFLIKEKGLEIEVPNSYKELKKMYKILVNTRIPNFISNDILTLEDKYLQLELNDKKIINGDKLEEIESGIILWQGDITTLKCDVIVNAGK